MTFNLNQLSELCAAAVIAAKRSGELIQSYAGADFTVQEKSSGSSPASQIVTEVDLKSQEIILDVLTPTLEAFDLGLLIEESDDDLSRFEKDYFWCVDPLDGTLPFVNQQPGYAVSIGLVSCEGVAVIGVVYDPLTETLYHAIKNNGACRNETPWRLTEEYAGSYAEVVSGGAVMSACQALETAPAYFMKQPKPIEGGGCLWDYAATVCLYEEIGGSASDSHGNPLELNSKDSLFMNQKGVLFASHPEIADAVKISPGLR